MATAIEPRTLISWMVEPSQRAPTRATSQTNGESFTATGAGSATTTVCTALTHATNDGYVARILRCVGGTAANVGVDVYVRSFNAGTDTLTHTDFPAATASGDQFVLYDVPDPVFVVTTGAGTTTITASARTETTSNYWTTGDYAVAKYSSNNGSGPTRAVTGYSTGVLTVGTAFSATTVGDIFVVRRFPKWWGPPTFNWQTEDLPYETQRANFDGDQSVRGCKSWSLEGVLPLKGPGTAAGDGTAAIPPAETHRLLDAVFATAAATGEAIAAGSTSVPEITDGTLAQMPVGSIVMDSAGRAAVVTATNADGANPDEITVNPPLNRTPIAGEILYGGYAYTPQTTGHLTMTVDAYIGDATEVQAYGGMCTSMKLVDFGRNKIPKLTFGLKGSYFLETAMDAISGALSRPTTVTHDTVRPVDAKDCHAILVASGTTTNTRLILEEASVDFGIETAEEPAFSLPDGMYGPRIVGHKPIVTVKGYLDTASPNDMFDELQRYMGGGTFSLLLQHDRRPGYTVVFYAHRCAWLSPKHGVTNKLRTVEFTAQVVSSELASMPMFVFGTV